MDAGMSSTVTTLTVMLYSNSVILLLIDLAPLPVLLIMIKKNTKHDDVNIMIIQPLIITVAE